MKYSQFIYALMLSTSFATMARAADTSYDNCVAAVGASNCVQIKNSGTYYALSGDAGNQTMTIYGTKESGSTAATVPEKAFVDGSWESTLPGGVTSLKTSGNVDIGHHAFWKATGLTSVDLTGVQSIGFDAFFKTTNLTSVDLTGVQSIGYVAFAFATGLTSVVISDSLLDAEGNILGWAKRDGVYTGVYTGNDADPFVGSGLNTIYCPKGKRCGNSLTGLSGGTPKIISYSKNDDGTYSVGENMYANADMMTKNIACEGEAQCAALRTALNAGSTCSTQEACNTLAAEYATPQPSQPSQPTKPQRADIRIYTIEEANAVAGEKNRVSIKYR